MSTIQFSEKGKLDLRAKASGRVEVASTPDGGKIVAEVKNGKVVGLGATGSGSVQVLRQRSFVAGGGSTSAKVRCWVCVEDINGVGHCHEVACDDLIGADEVAAISVES